MRLKAIPAQPEPAQPLVPNSTGPRAPKAVLVSPGGNFDFLDGAYRSHRRSRTRNLALAGTVGLGALALVLQTVGFYFTEQDAKQQQRASALSQRASEAELAAEYDLGAATPSALTAHVAQRATAATAVQASTISVPQLMSDLRRVAPSAVTITGVQVGVGGPTGVPVTVTVTSPTYDGVAAWIQASAQLPYLVSARHTSGNSGAGSQVMTTTVTVTATQLPAVDAQVLSDYLALTGATAPAPAAPPAPGAPTPGAPTPGAPTSDPEGAMP